mmetsp:Transcript_27625/g.42265  ORF Transcript_27625/g.42265 Transcript_27625/m.42265 type:complete len:376 (-) Transcript_27625:148-1275(-)
MGRFFSFALFAVSVVSFLCSAVLGSETSIAAQQQQFVKDRPVIGILSTPNHNHTETYVAASYVKWLEAAGARSIVIPFYADDDTVEDIFGQINGLLLPGGTAIDAVPDSVKKLWSLAKKSNDDGDVFPIWGTCLSFEYMVWMIGDYGRENIQDGFDSHNISLPLHFTEAVVHSRALADIEVQTITATQPVTMNVHRHGIEPETFANDPGLSSFFDVIATSFDGNGREFVSVIEAKSYPFYGVQFHPEKPNFEYSTYPGTDIPVYSINHSEDAVEVMFRLAKFFVSEARRNKGGQYTKVRTYPSIWTYHFVNGQHFQQRMVITRKVPPKTLQYTLHSNNSWVLIGCVAMLMISSVIGPKISKTMTENNPETRVLLA